MFHKTKRYCFLRFSAIVSKSGFYNITFRYGTLIVSMSYDIYLCDKTIIYNVVLIFPWIYYNMYIVINMLLDKIFLIFNSFLIRTIRHTLLNKYGSLPTISWLGFCRLSVATFPYIHFPTSTRPLLITMQKYSMSCY